MGEGKVRCPVARLVAPRVEPFRNSRAVRAEAPSNHRRDVLQQPEPVSAPKNRYVRQAQRQTHRKRQAQAKTHRWRQRRTHGQRQREAQRQGEERVYVWAEWVLDLVNDNRTGRADQLLREHL